MHTHVENAHPHVTFETFVLKLGFETCTHTHTHTHTHTYTHACVQTQLQHKPTTRTHKCTPTHLQHTYTIHLYTHKHMCTLHPTQHIYLLHNLEVPYLLPLIFFFFNYSIQTHAVALPCHHALGRLRVEVSIGMYMCIRACICVYMCMYMCIYVHACIAFYLIHLIVRSSISLQHKTMHSLGPMKKCRPNC